MVDALNAIEGLSCIRPDGRVMESDQDFAAYLLERAGVATVPGTAFGLSPHLRLSFASSTELLQEACQRIGRACAKLRGLRRAPGEIPLTLAATGGFVYSGAVWQRGRAENR